MPSKGGYWPVFFCMWHKEQYKFEEWLSVGVPWNKITRHTSDDPLGAIISLAQINHTGQISCKVAKPYQEVS